MELLDLLKRNNVRATFFVVGNNMGKGHINDASSGYAPMIQHMAADGHQVGSHTWSHQDLNAATREQRRAEIISNEIALADILGAVPTYFRPPYTRCGGACLAELLEWGYHVVNYDIDTRDWQDGGAAAKTTYQTILAQHSPASSAWLALAHDVHEFTVHRFAQFMVDTARALRYDLVTVGECLGDPPANWYRDPVTGQPMDLTQPRPSSSSSSSQATKTSTSTKKTSISTSSSQTTSTSTSKTQTPVTSKPAMGATSELEHTTGTDATSAATELLSVVLASALVSTSTSSNLSALPTAALLAVPSSDAASMISTGGFCWVVGQILLIAWLGLGL